MEAVLGALASIYAAHAMEVCHNWWHVERHIGGMGGFKLVRSPIVGVKSAPVLDEFRSLSSLLFACMVPPSLISNIGSRCAHQRWPG